MEDGYRIRKSLMLNIGLRYERLGQFGDELGSKTRASTLGKRMPTLPQGGA